MDPIVKTNLQQGYKPTMSDILRTLSAAIRLLRNCGVNAALTVQLFSHVNFFNLENNFTYVYILVISKANLILTRFPFSFSNLDLSLHQSTII